MKSKPYFINSSLSIHLNHKIKSVVSKNYENVKKGILLWYVVGYLREAWGKTGEELPDS